MNNKKIKNKSIETKDSYKKEVLEFKSKIVKELKKIINTFEVINFRKFKLINKLRLIVTIIFLLFTISIIFALINFLVTVLLLLVIYFLLFIFMLRLLTIKKL